VSHAIVVRYRAKPEAAEANQQLVRDVYKELAELQPDGFHYITMRLGDGDSFVHVALHDENAENPLSQLPAFQRFQSGLSDRVVDGPHPLRGSVVGSYAFMTSEHA